jgi:hypothetical protein
MATKKVHSSEEPNWYFLDKIRFKLDDGNPYLTLRLHWNIEEVLIHDPEPRTEWQYDEQVIEHAPIDTLTKEEVVSYIEAHPAELLEEAQNRQVAKTVVDANIETVRAEPVIPIWEEKLFEERGLYVSEVNEIDITKPDKRYFKVMLIKKEITANPIKADIYKWCFVTGSILRDFKESKVAVGDIVLVGYVEGRDAPTVIDRIVL